MLPSLFRSLLANSITGKFKFNADKPKVRKDWDGLKPYKRGHGDTEYDRKKEKEEAEKAIDEELEEKASRRK